MSDEKAVPNQSTYQGELVDGQVILTSVQHPSEYVGEDGQVVMTCEPVEVNALTFDEEYPFATSPFDEGHRPPVIARDQTVMHQTIGGKGVVGRIK